MPKHRFALVACARWEEAHILEWVEYHRSIGFDHIYLYSNDDDPLPLFRIITPYVYGPNPFITYRHWPLIGQQDEIYLHFLDTFRHETEWFSYLDIDEFLVLKRKDNISAFMHDYQDSVDCLYLHWMIYGNSGRLRREDVPTLTTYLRRSAKPDSHTKMICRASAIDPADIRRKLESGVGAFWHFMDRFLVPGLRCQDVRHESMQGYSLDFPASTWNFLERDAYAEAVIDRAYIAHFQFRSEEDYLRRVRRGGFSNGELWRVIYETGAHKAMLEENNAVYDSYLADYWHRYTAAARHFNTQPVVGVPPQPNVALNKPSFQSSIYEPSSDEPANSRVSGGANNGFRTRTYGFHTQYQAQPWWAVDLLAPHHLAEIHLYNRIDHPALAARANELDVSVSPDGNNWTLLLSRTATEPFGLDGAPLIVKASASPPCRFILLRLRGGAYFHLDEVEVYGEPVQQA